VHTDSVKRIQVRHAVWSGRPVGCRDGGASPFGVREDHRGCRQGGDMPFAVNRGCRIAFDVVGEGATVLLQGGLTSRKLDVARLGYVDAFADGYQVVNVDS